MNALVVGVENPLHRMRGSYRQRALLHDYFVRFGSLDYIARRLFPVLEVGGPARSLAERFGRRVDGYEQDVGQRMAASTSVEKNRFLPLAFRTTSSNPGS